ncbi:hypothetical protein KZZ52_27830 [Dactylosporangium sp. AC04546]|uniref:hypothetical protein n=1 Tax=Dactylosporangium sp. AC04546 TaxID=2862460 RepID=UPI001EE04770|nr:hypothetical protein [Dactylosporangium sp. AC04546]WVK89077.1 hypothetical protein KZZ52_27830 [Dactylosporangium sp. AC04546]
MASQQGFVSDTAPSTALPHVRPTSSLPRAVRPPRAKPLPARSRVECLLYIELHPCPCGQADVDWARPRESRIDGRRAATFDGDCHGCGTSRGFQFHLPDEPVAPPAFGGAEPSRIIGPHEFLALGRRAEAAVAGDPARLPIASAEAALHVLTVAIAAHEEVVKFIPPDGPAVPREAFTSDAARSAFDHAPDGYDRAALTARLADYRTLERAYRRRLAPH